MSTVRDVMFVSGVCLAISGVWLVSPAGAMIAAGAVLAVSSLAWGWFNAR